MKTIRIDAEVHARLKERRELMRETNPRATYSDGFRQIMEIKRMARDARREQPAEEIEVWERWTWFTDAAMVAPDTPRDAEWLVARYFEAQGKRITADEVRAMMPENHRTTR